MTPQKPGDAEAAERIARRILADCFGREPERLRSEGGGLSNHVFSADAPEGGVVIRLGPEPQRLASFRREERVIAMARQAGVPAPEVLQVGGAEGWAYMLARNLPGQAAVHHPKRMEVLEALGGLARRIHAVATRGCGRDFDAAESSEPCPDWRDWLLRELEAHERLERLHEARVISRPQLTALEATLQEVSAWDAPAALQHGDLRLKNVVVDEVGAIGGLLDWEHAISAVGPHWDLSVALHDLSVDAKEALLKGYGMDAEEVRAAAPAWRLFNALNYAPALARALRAGDTGEVERIRLRFSGALDLYG